MGRYAAVVAAMLVMGAPPVYAQDAVFVVMTTSADIHKAPSTGSAVIGKAARGKTFEVRRELGSWVSVSWPDAEQGVAYLHVAWGRISRGADVQAPAATGVAPAGRGPGAGIERIDERRSDQAPRTTTLPRRAPSLPSHVIGFGGRMASREIGFAATGRAWTYGPFGVQIEAGRPTYTKRGCSGTVAVAAAGAERHVLTARSGDQRHLGAAVRRGRRRPASGDAQKRPSAMLTSSITSSARTSSAAPSSRGRTFRSSP